MPESCWASVASGGAKKATCCTKPGGPETSTLSDRLRPKYDLLEDWPWPLVYKEMAESFPDSRFVLTRRTSAAVWFKSQRHHIKKYGPHRGIYGDMTEKEAPEKYQAFYENHLREARSYFAGTGRMLEVCWDEGDGWEQLCPFLGRPIPDIAFPHSNPTPTFSRRVKTRIPRAREVRRGGPTSFSPG